MHRFWTGRTPPETLGNPCRIFTCVASVIAVTYHSMYCRGGAVCVISDTGAVPPPMIIPHTCSHLNDPILLPGEDQLCNGAVGHRLKFYDRNVVFISTRSTRSTILSSGPVDDTGFPQTFLQCNRPIPISQRAKCVVMRRKIVHPKGQSNR